MARMQDITLTGSGSNEYVLKPQSLVDNLGVWREIVGSLVEREWLTATVRPASTQNSGHKVSLRLSVPHPVDVSAGCCVDNNAPLPFSYFSVEFLREKTADDASIEDLIAQAISLLGNTQIQALFKGEGLMG